jgi:hypothetical protein
MDCAGSPRHRLHSGRCSIFTIHSRLRTALLLSANAAPAYALHDTSGTHHGTFGRTTWTLTTLTLQCLSLARIKTVDRKGGFFKNLKKPLKNPLCEQNHKGLNMMLDALHNHTFALRHQNCFWKQQPRSTPVSVYVFVAPV